MSNLIEIPEEVYPEFVPLLEADEFYYVSPRGSDIFKQLSTHLGEIFPYISSKVFDEINDLLIEEKHRLIMRQHEIDDDAVFNDHHIWAQFSSEAWCNVMTTLGYTEISDDDR